MGALTCDGPNRVKMRNKPEPKIEYPQDGIVLPVTDAFTTGYQAAEMCELRGGETVLVLAAVRSACSRCGPRGPWARAA